MDEAKCVLLIINSITNQEIQEVKNAIDNSRVRIEINLLYVKPRLPTYYFHIPSMITLADHCENEAKRALNKAGEILNVSRENQWIATGKVKNETIKLASHLKAHFILAGAAEHEQITQCFTFTRASNRPAIETISDIHKLCHKSFQAVESREERSNVMR